MVRSWAQIIRYSPFAIRLYPRKQMPSTLQTLILAAACMLAAAPLARADKLDDVKTRGRLLVGTSDTSPPFSALALPMETLSIINADRIPALQQDRVDLVASGITRAENRKKDVGFSLAYLVSPHKVLIRKDGGIATVGQMAGRKLALVKSASVDAELKAAVQTLQIVFYEDYAACFKALRDKQVDGFLADEVLLASFAQKSGAPQDFTFIPDYELPRTAGFAIKKDEPRFTKFVDQVLLDLEKSGEAEKIFDAWFAPAKRPFRIQPD
jgi:polar amino acid transport system substrate-binding protein